MRKSVLEILQTRRYKGTRACKWAARENSHELWRRKWVPVFFFFSRLFSRFISREWHSLRLIYRINLLFDIPRKALHLPSRSSNWKHTRADRYIYSFICNLIKQFVKIFTCLTVKISFREKAADKQIISLDDFHHGKIFHSKYRAKNIRFIRKK